MTAFAAYWQAYASDSEATDRDKAGWSEETLASGIVDRACSMVVESLSETAGSRREESAGLIALSGFSVGGMRVTVIGLNGSAEEARYNLQRELSERCRETICFALLPHGRVSVWPLLERKLEDGAASVIPLYPRDADAIAEGRVGVSDLLEYKLHRRLMLEKPDSDTQYEEPLFKQFDAVRKRGEGRLRTIGEVLAEGGDDYRSWVEHPLAARVIGQIARHRGCLLVGPSSSGKSILALQAGRTLELGGHAVRYLNLGGAEVFPSGVKNFLLHSGGQGKDAVLIVDDLQSNPAAARLILAVSTAGQRASVGDYPVTLGISWVDFAQEAATWYESCLPVAVRAHQVRQRLTTEYGAGLDGGEINALTEQFGDDLLLLRLALETSLVQGSAATAAQIAEKFWDQRTKEADVEEGPAKRAALVSGVLGRFDLACGHEFLAMEAQVGANDVQELIETKLLRPKLGQLTLGHRSLCGLVSDWLEGLGVWQQLDAVGGPRSVAGVVLDHLKSLGTGPAVETLRGLQARAGFKKASQLSRRASALVEIWRAFNALVERMERQQSADPTWGGIPSSAMFAVEAFSEIGRNDLAQLSLAFLRSHWNLTDWSLIIDTDALATGDDFEQIRQEMVKEDESFTADTFPGSWQKGEEIDPELFHYTWVSGLVLGSEALAEVPGVSLLELAQSVEGLAGESGAFYPERVPWCTARVLLGLAACGRTLDTSDVVSRAVDWLLRDRSQGGAQTGGIWEAGTGSWNSSLETTGMVLLALSAVGFDCEDAQLATARNYLLSTRKKWASTGRELDGVMAIQAYLDTGGQWEEVAAETQQLARWARSEALWLGATKSAKESLTQSCLAAQVASHLISIGWTAIRSDLPAFVDALATPKRFAIADPAQPSDKAPAAEKPTASRPAAIGEPAAHGSRFRAVEELDKLSLGDCTVVGKYRRFQERDRSRLKTWAQEIARPLREQTEAHENFLVWGAPGSGKTFFVKQIAEELGDTIEFVELDLAKQSEAEFMDGLGRVTESKKPTLCLLDEVDAREGEKWPYESCYRLLDRNKEGEQQVVFVLIGSSPTGIQGMTRGMEERWKGEDLVSRIPNEKRFEIPGMTLGDQLILFVSLVLDAAEKRAQSLNEIEKLALYYVVKQEGLLSPRQLGDLAAAAVGRMSADDDRLRYDDLFFRGNRRNQEFWLTNESAASVLSESFVKIEGQLGNKEEKQDES